MKSEISIRQLMDILETLDVGVIYTDIDGNMLYINKLAEEIRGIKREQRLGTNVIDCHAAKGQPHVRQLLDQFKAGSIDHRHRLVRIGQKYFDNKYLVVRGEDSKPSGIVLMSQDVTEKLQLKQKLDEHYQTLNQEIEKKSKEIESRYEELMRMQQRLLHSEKMSSLGQFVSIVAHEVNNPLDGIKNCLRAIKDEPNNIAQTEKYTSLALDAVERIEKVVRLVLNYARPDNYCMEQVSISEIIKESINFTQYKLDRNDIQVETDWDSDFYVNGCKQHLSQVFVNLILNSIDAIHEKRLEATEEVITGRNRDFIRIRIDDCDDTVCVTFTDTGCGIKSEDRNQLFKPFYTTKKEKGTGLGLYVCYNIIYVHNGKITVDNAPEGGAVFRIHLPKYASSTLETRMGSAEQLRERVLQDYIEY